MFTKAYIKEVPASGSNIFKVEIPVMEDNTGNEVIFDALLCGDPSTFNGYSVGDAVYVTFENNKLNDCVIVGKLYTEVSGDSTSYSLLNELKVTGTVELPEDTKFGQYSVKDITNLYNNTNSKTTTIIEGGEQEYHTFVLKPGKWKEVSLPSQYYNYILTSDASETEYDYVPELYKVTGEETPTWDIVVDPNDTSIPYKTQIKYRAWCTTLNTYPGKIEVMAMNKPGDNITLSTKGLNLGFTEDQYGNRH